jgi:hypothetical protein
MGQFITLGEFLIISIVSLFGYVLIKTIVQTIKTIIVCLKVK